MAFSAFDRTLARPLMERVDADGRIQIQAYAHASLTAKTPYGTYIAYDGWRTGTLGSVTIVASDSVQFNAGRWKVCIPMVAASTADLVWVQTGGVASGTIGTATTLALGEFVEVSNSAVTLGAATSAIPEFNTFAICYTASSSTSVELLLLNRFVIGRA